MKVLKLGTEVSDIATGMWGELTHLTVQSDKTSLRYIFQPRGINKKTSQPLEPLYIGSDRVKGGQEIDVDLPLEVLGTEVRDRASGFSGTAIGIVYHINGCVHFDVQPSGTTEDGAAIQSHNFDIRRLEGVAIPKMTEAALVQDRKDRPSPEPMPTFRIPQTQGPRA